MNGKRKKNRITTLVRNNENNKKKSKTKKLKCSVINRCCFSVNLYVVALQKQSGKYVSRFLESSGKVLEFRVSNIVGNPVLCTPMSRGNVFATGFGELLTGWASKR